MILLLILLKMFLTSSSSLFAKDKPSLDKVETPTDSLYASVKFSTKLMISDTLCEGEVTDFKYQLTNIGNTTLYISSIRSSCGCYVPTWPKKSILAGDSTVIIGRYSSYNRPGPFNRSLTVVFQNNKILRTVLYVRGYTKAKALCLK